MTNENTSATGGYLAPKPAPAPEPMDDPELTRTLQQMVVGITGLPGPLVRPRWQPVPPAQPEADVNWCAIAVMHFVGDFDAVVAHKPAGIDGGQGESILTRHEELDVLCSFYGPHRAGYAALLRDGLALSQNRVALREAGIVLGFVGDIRPAPAFINQQWVQKADMPIALRREVRRAYPVLSLTRLPAEAVTDRGLRNTIGCIPEEE